VNRLGDLVRCVRDQADTDTSSGGWIGLHHLVSGQLRMRPPGTAHEPDDHAAPTRDASGYRVRPGDLLFGALRPASHKLALATRSGVCSPEILVLRPRDVPAGLALAALAHPHTLARAAQLAQGTRMPRVRWSDLADICPPLPPAERWPALGRAVLAITRRLDLLHARDHADVALLRAALAQALPPSADPSSPRGPRLGDVATRRGQALPRGSVDPHTPCLGLADLAPGELAVHATPGPPGSGSLVPMHRGDVLLPLLRPSSGKLALGPVDGVTSAEVLVLHVDPAWRVAVVAWLLQAHTVRTLGWRAGGTRMPRLPRHVALDLRLPPVDPARLQPLDPLLDRATRAPELARSLRSLRARVIARASSERVSGAVSPLEAS